MLGYGHGDFMRENITLKNCKKLVMHRDVFNKPAVTCLEFKIFFQAGKRKVQMNVSRNSPIRIVEKNWH